MTAIMIMSNIIIIVIAVTCHSKPLEKLKYEPCPCQMFPLYITNQNHNPNQAK